MKTQTPILPYSRSRAVYVEYDPGAVGAAAEVATLVEAAAPWTQLEHIGSTAIPGCAGKGIVDLMAMYAPGELDPTRAALDALGFQKQRTGHIFSEERPMRVGAIDHAGKHYRLHVHVIDVTSDEVVTLRRFRDALRADARLRNAYQARKRAILESGLHEPKDYTDAKGEFITSVIGRQ